MTRFELYNYKDYDCSKITPNVLYGGTSREIYEGTCDTTILPYDNTIAGYIDTYDYFLKASTLLKENKNIIDDIKSVYITPNCKMSRSQITNKYKKTLNPWLADAIIIPELDTKTQNKCHLLSNVAVFINELHKTVYIIEIDSKDTTMLLTLKENVGKSLRSIINENQQPWYDPSATYDSTLEFFGRALSIPSSESWICDILTGIIPNNKLLYESTLAKSLGSADNKFTADSISNIIDLLSSSESETISVGLKALANMDYNNFPNIAIYILRNNYCNWVNNKARHSVAVKYMLNILKCDKGYPSFNNTTTDEEYAILYPFIKNTVDSNCVKSISNCQSGFPFIRLTSELQYKIEPVISA